MRQSLPDRFWSKVEKTDGCWLWKASLTRDGYGRIAIGRGQWMLAHRCAFALTHDGVPSDLLVCHHCDTPPCVRPDHLFLGTSADNTHDMMAKGRFRHPKAGITHCKRGHPFDERNTYRHSRSRHCRPCRAEDLRRFRRRHRAEVVDHENDSKSA